MSQFSGRSVKFVWITAEVEKTLTPWLTQHLVKALKAIIELLKVMFNAIYKKKLPAYNRGLSSKLSF